MLIAKFFSLFEWHDARHVVLVAVLIAVIGGSSSNKPKAHAVISNRIGMKFGRIIHQVS